MTARTADGVLAAADYADAVMTRYIVEDGAIRDDLLTRNQLRDWVDGIDPLTGQRRGRDLESPVADLVLDATINAPKSFSIAAMLDGELNAAYEDLQDRLRDRIIKMWQTELNARRGKAGCIRENLTRVEVVELKHERSRSLDPHMHRHLWLNVKVQGTDGKWSNVDTRVALRFQNVVNAEGDLACRTDPVWVAALAAKGLTLNGRGEIGQLEHLVRPLSKRSAQIEANKTVRTQWWKEQHPGQEPSRDVLNQIDRWAWATDRPNKPGHLNEDDWATLVRGELLAADKNLGHERVPVTVDAVPVIALDLGLLAAKAIVDADNRSTGTGGRFNVMDVRAGAVRAIASTGLVTDRSELDAIIDRVTNDAIGAHTVTLLTEPNIPDHVKRLMATSTASVKTAVAHRIESICTPGEPLQREEVLAVGREIEPERVLDIGQLGGAAAIAGSSRVVSVTGAAGTGKTTMLKVAGAALRRHGHNMIIVAPTKKASSVAGRETNSASSSLHQLLHDYGWRWATNQAGATEWTRLQRGEVDSSSGLEYSGPRKQIRSGDRIVVDEAGMLELEAANALLEVLESTGASVAVVGDDYQALPVGHSGAMALFRRRAFDQLELDVIHRFRDPDWAELTSRLRDPEGPEDAGDVADELIKAGHVLLANNDAEARQTLVDGWFDAARHRQTVALVTATHAEAQEISEAIQAQRIQRGDITAERSVVGQADQAIFESDIVQTRRNDSTSGVDNRQTWIIKNITTSHVILESVSDASELRKITHDYAAAHVHLGYASTVYGVQGETTDRSIVGPGVDAAGLYVGLTRGRQDNQVVVTTPTLKSARTELTETMQRSPIEETLDISRTAARSELSRAARADAVQTGPIAGTGSIGRSSALTPL
ncbi:AAA family ATPase [Leifsonia sp. Root112D2]|uniref:AAA family ATPase n=1 Tax=Leifsonia sp. Root112D2 TaxID=1736426 RepID=UPI001F48CDAF|nr:AAA family ATPase [Leifsonia sp. Root112D2]